eukprot:TRINITY_DN332_c0_g1_i2.p1 TRINITY_DN332_c0_g1~~TRINITY_DN332_c0_g1_i2.p1  ORF type:complete len:385 (-),score=50.11 TRINITY_DN332_c0_g1_i2:1061-2215(-)
MIHRNLPLPRSQNTLGRTRSLGNRTRSRRFEGGRKRTKRVDDSDESAEPPPFRTGRRRVTLPSDSSSSSDEGVQAAGEATESSPEVGDQSATSSEWGDRHDYDDPTWDWDDEGDSEELREFFGVCRIDLGFERDCTESEQGPSPAVEAPISTIDPILAAAHHFHSLRVVTVTHDLFEKKFSNGQVRKPPCNWASDKSWKEANLGNCLQEFAKPGRNSIAIVMEHSDIYALDVDVKDGGFEALDRMVTENDVFPDDTPHVITGNGGLHLLFSLSKSEDAGLLNSSNRAKIPYSGEVVGIDVRGRGGMLYTAPSSYKGLDGTRRSYEWKKEILPDRSNLRAVPDWLLRILNGGGEAPGGRGRMARDGEGARYVRLDAFFILRQTDV